MRSNKAGLADLKRLHEAATRARERAQALEATRAPAQPINALPTVDEKLFAQVTRAVQPLQKGSDRLLHKPVTLTPDLMRLSERRQRAVGERLARVPQLSDGATPVTEAETSVTWIANGIGPDVLRQLRRAFWPVGAQLDLHGLNSDQARAALVAFIEQSRTHGTRCVCIIHGKGYGSAQGQPVLPARVRQWLKQMPEVSAFAPAPPAHGGAGALLALIRLT